MLKNLRARGMQKMAGKLNKSIPAFINFAVENDTGYESLMNTIKKINRQRYEKKRYVYPIALKRC